MPTGVQVMVLFDAYYLCRRVVRACREQHFPCASILKSNRGLLKQGWQLKAGRYGRDLFRRRRTDTLVIDKPHSIARYRFVDAGWLEVGNPGQLHVVFSHKGTQQKILGLVTVASELSITEVIRTYEKRWAIEQFWKDAKQLWGLGQYQNRSYRAAVIHLHLVCFAYALFTHLRMMRHGAQGQQTHDKAGGMSVVAAQEALRALV